MNTRMTAIETEMKGVEARLASKVDPTTTNPTTRTNSDTNKDIQ